MVEFPSADLDLAVEIAGDAFARLKGARLFVTGGTGFLGRWLLHTLAHADRRLGLGVEVTVLTRDPNRAALVLPGIDLWTGTIRAFPFPPGAFSHVIHAAGDGARGGAPADILADLADGSRQIARFAQERHLQEVLVVGSGAVYGRQGGPVAEDARPGPLPSSPAAAAYVEGKRIAEAALPQARHARLFTTIGPGQPLDGPYAAGNFIADGLAGRPISVRGDGTAVRSYLYAAEVAAWLWMVLVKGTPGRAYNVGSSEAISIADLAQTVSFCFNPPPPVLILGQAKTGNVDHYLPDVGRAEAELGLRPVVELGDAVQRTIRWWKGRRV